MEHLFTNKIPHPLLLASGQSQHDRNQYAPDPHQVKIDGRSMVDILDFLYRFARHVHYYDAKLQVANWQPFFQKSLPFLLARIVKTDLDQIEAHMSTLADLYCRQPQPQHLKRALDCIYESQILMLDQWYRQLESSDLRFIDVLERLIGSNLQESLQGFVALANAAHNKWGIGTYDFLSLSQNAIWGLEFRDCFIQDSSLSLKNGKKEQIEIWNDVSPIFSRFLEVMRELKLTLLEDKEGYFQESLYPEEARYQENHQPHLGLLFGFLELFQTYQADLNSLSEKHLEYFLKEVLQMQSRAARPDQVHIVFELQKHITKPYKLDGGRQLQDAKDINGADIFFALDEEIILDKTQLASFRTLFLNHSYGQVGGLVGKQFVEGLYVAPDATKADGLEEDFQGDGPHSWPTLGAKLSKFFPPVDPGVEPEAKPYPNGQLGFVLASPVLWLQEGERRIRVRISCEMDQEAAMLEKETDQDGNETGGFQIREALKTKAFETQSCVILKKEEIDAMAKELVSCSKLLLWRPDFPELPTPTVQEEQGGEDDPATSNEIIWEEILPQLRERVGLLGKFLASIPFGCTGEFKLGPCTEGGGLPPYADMTEFERLLISFMDTIVADTPFMNGEGEKGVIEVIEALKGIMDPSNMPEDLPEDLKKLKDCLDYFLPDPNYSPPSTDPSEPQNLYLLIKTLRDANNCRENILTYTQPNGTSLFTAQLSGLEEWLQVKPEQTQSSLFFETIESTQAEDGSTIPLSSPIYLLHLDIDLSLDPKDPAVAFFKSDKLEEFYTTPYPILQLKLNDAAALNCSVDGSEIRCALQACPPGGKLDISFYHFLRGAEVCDVCIEVEVCGVKNMIVQNDENLQDVKDLIYPFGVRPSVEDQPPGLFAPNADLKGSNFFIGSKEIFCKQWENLWINLTWKDKPASFKEHYFGYDDLTVGLGNILEENFQIKMSLLENQRWIKEQSEDPQPNPWLDAPDAEPVNRRLFDSDTPKVAICPDPNIDFDQTIHVERSFFELSPDPKSFDDSPLGQYLPDTFDGFLRMTLKEQDFQHDRYAFVLARQMLAYGKFPEDYVFGAVYATRVEPTATDVEYSEMGKNFKVVVKDQNSFDVVKREKLDITLILQQITSINLFVQAIVESLLGFEQELKLGLDDMVQAAKDPNQDIIEDLIDELTTSMGQFFESNFPSIIAGSLTPAILAEIEAVLTPKIQNDPGPQMTGIELIIYTSIGNLFQGNAPIFLQNVSNAIVDLLHTYLEGDPDTVLSQVETVIQQTLASEIESRVFQGNSTLEDVVYASIESLANPSNDPALEQDLRNGIKNANNATTAAFTINSVELSTFAEEISLQIKNVLTANGSSAQGDAFRDEILGLIQGLLNGGTLAPTLEATVLQLTKLLSSAINSIIADCLDVPQTGTTPLMDSLNTLISTALDNLFQGSGIDTQIRTEITNVIRHPDFFPLGTKVLIIDDAFCELWDGKSNPHPNVQVQKFITDYGINFGKSDQDFYNFIETQVRQDNINNTTIVKDGLECMGIVAQVKGMEKYMVVSAADSARFFDQFVVIPNEPYTPIIKDIALDYTASATSKKGEIDFFHLLPFEKSFQQEHLLNSEEIEQLEPEEPCGPTLLPTYDQEGSLFLGLQNATPGSIIPILFQVAEPTANTEVPKAEISWSYYRKTKEGNNEWAPLQDLFHILSDETKGLTRSGIVKINLPADATNEKVTVLPPEPKELHWIKIEAPANVAAICEVIGIHTQAAKASFDLQPANDTARLDTGLEAGKVAKLAQADSSIKAVKQLYEGFGGRPAETQVAEVLYTRASEQMRHKSRGINTFDYERLVLEAFPNVYRVKCITHSFGLPGERYKRDAQWAPGFTTLVVVPDLVRLKVAKPLFPRLPASQLGEIQDFLKSRISPFVRMKVMNPRYEQVHVKIEVYFQAGRSKTFYTEELKQDIREFLAPWTAGEPHSLLFGRSVSRSDLIQLVECLEYVDYIKEISLFHDEDDESHPCYDPTKAINPDLVVGRTPRSILTSGTIQVIGEDFDPCGTYYQASS